MAGRPGLRVAQSCEHGAELVDDGLALEGEGAGDVAAGKGQKVVLGAVATARHDRERHATRG
ncbi:hypothetical protein ACFT8W_00535 [Streptomyces hygroscopicus]|uniref:hypothetical protein n=1 Tax=Streptomyces hygroscopicus TaxID=1912 RepID=UPI00363E5924